MLKNLALTKIDRSMVRHGRPDLHKQYIMPLRIAFDGDKPCFGVMIQVEIAAFIPPVILARPVLKLDTKFALEIVVNKLHAIRNAVAELASNQWRLVPRRLKHVDFARHAVNHAHDGPRQTGCFARYLVRLRWPCSHVRVRMDNMGDFALVLGVSVVLRV